jgi:hypothetical protein
VTGQVIILKEERKVTTSGLSGSKERCRWQVMAERSKRASRRRLYSSWHLKAEEESAILRGGGRASRPEGATEQMDHCK